MPRLNLLNAFALALAPIACGGGSEAPPAEPPDAATFVFRLRGAPASEQFRVSTSSPDFIAAARAQLSLPESQRDRFVAGSIQAGSGGHNAGWSWHFSQPALVRSAIELCDGTPSMVEADLTYWLNKVGSFCPWLSYVHAELD